MNKDRQHKIDQYLNGSLSDEEKIEFEKELYTSLQSELEQHQLNERTVFQKFTKLRLEISLLNFSFSEILKGL